MKRLRVRLPLCASRQVINTYVMCLCRKLMLATAMMLCYCGANYKWERTYDCELNDLELYLFMLLMTNGVVVWNSWLQIIMDTFLETFDNFSHSFMAINKQRMAWNIQNAVFSLFSSTLYISAIALAMSQTQWCAHLRV